MQCYLVAILGLHFKLTRPAKLSWAAKLSLPEDKRTTTLDAPPIGSNFFREKDAFARDSQLKKQEVAPPQTPAPATTTVTATLPVTSADSPTLPFANATARAWLGPGSHLAQAYPSYPYLYGPPPPYFPPPMYPSYFPPAPYSDRILSPRHPELRSPGHYGSSQTAMDSDIRSSSPIPFDEDVSIEDWCKTYHLNEHIHSCLIELGFVVGDSLKALEREDITQAGFKPLEWQRVLQADRRWRRDHKKK